MAGRNNVRPRRGDPVRVLTPDDYRGYEGVIEVPLWTRGEGDRVIGVLLYGLDRLVWVTAVEVLNTFRYRI